MHPPVIHVVGAGLAGLAAALRIGDAGIKAVVHEAAGQAGGRCRSYYDGVLAMNIDNGNHLVLSGNYATADYLRRIGAADRLTGPPEPAFPFVDLATKQRWHLRPNAGRLPWWIFVADRRVPGTGAIDYLKIARLLVTSTEASVADVIDCRSVLFQRLWRPLLLAALNTDPSEASARLAAAILRETLLAGGAACRPLIASGGLSEAFVEPAIARVESRGGEVRFGARLRAMGFGSGRVESLDLGEQALRLGPEDAVVLAVPAWVATSLVPGIDAPSEFRAIVNAHFQLRPPADLPPMIGVVNATVEWVFRFQDRLSVTISAADRLLDASREELARTIWCEVAQITGIVEPLPPWQIIKERRATFAAIPRQDAKRPGTTTGWRNLALAGDWTATGLPGTIEGAIRSGNKAAELALRAVKHETAI